MKVIFDKSVQNEIIDIFDMKVSENGIIVDKKTGEVCLDPFGDPVNIDEFAGFIKGNNGSPIPVNNKIHTLIMLADQMVES